MPIDSDGSRRGDLTEHSLRAEIRQLEQLVATRDASVARLTNDVRRLEEAIAAQRDSRWMMLGEVLRRRPFAMAELAHVIELGRKMLQSRLFPRRPGDAVAAPTAETEAHRQASPLTPEPCSSPTAPPPVTAYVVKVPIPAAGRKSKVLHVIANFMLGGSSRLVVDLIEGLGGSYEHRILTSFAPTPPAFVGVTIDVLKIEASASQFSRCIADADPDLIHLHYWGSTDEPWYRRALAAVTECRCPVIENVNTPVAPLRSARIDRYVFVSDYVKDQFGDERESESVIYPGSDVAMFAPSTDRNDDGNTVGMVYRLERDKLDENAIDPMIEAVRRRPATRVLIVGGGTLLEGFRQKVHAAGCDGQFEFTGYVPYEALPGHYDRMTIFAAPVWKESFGQVSTFAMSMGIPVVGYSTGAIPEIVCDDTLVAHFPDASALAAIIVNLLDDPGRRAVVAARNRERARTSFTVDAMVDRYARLYGTLAGRAE